MVKLVHKSVQTIAFTPVITAKDLTSDEPGVDYWIMLAKKRKELYQETLLENEQLKETINVLQDENKICKEMLEESKCLVEVLQVSLVNIFG